MLSCFSIYYQMPLMISAWITFPITFTSCNLNVCHEQKLLMLVVFLLTVCLFLVLGDMTWKKPCKVKAGSLQQLLMRIGRSSSKLERYQQTFFTKLCELCMSTYVAEKYIQKNMHFILKLTDLREQSQKEKL